MSSEDNNPASLNTPLLTTPEETPTTTTALIIDSKQNEAATTTELGIGNSNNVIGSRNMTGDRISDNGNVLSSSSLRFIKKIPRMMISFVTDEDGKGTPVVMGLFTLFSIGTCLGLLLPKNEELPTIWYRSISDVIGYTYFLCWSVSFYPQVISNYKRKTTMGLSIDFCGLNVIGFACYTIYNLCFFFNKTIQHQYEDRHNTTKDDITVESNDVAFAVHAFILASITFYQIIYYDKKTRFHNSNDNNDPEIDGDNDADDEQHLLVGQQQQQQNAIQNQSQTQQQLHVPATAATTTTTTTTVNTFSKSVQVLIIVIFFVCCIGLILVVTPVSNLEWLDFIYLLSYIKLFITLIKYIPQVLLNYQRKSTSGWSIWNIILDFTGGFLSILQLIFDCIDLNDFSGITGNAAKFGLGFVSIFFDIVFMLQHYVFYNKEHNNTNNNSSSNVNSHDSTVNPTTTTAPVATNAVIARV